MRKEPRARLAPRPRNRPAIRIPSSHTVEFFELLGGGKRDAGWDHSGMTQHRLAILPGVTHYDINVQPALSAAVIPFLDAR